MAPRHLAVLPPAPVDRVEIQLGHVCNNRCVFCVSGQRTAQGLARPLPTAPALAALDEAAAAGAHTVTFLGGEPTLQASLLPAIAHAIDLGFRAIVLFTNGVKTARASYVDEILTLGAARGFTGFEWRFSIQGGDEAAHDHVTQKPGSFARLVEGMRHLRARGQALTANACINERSYRSLPGYVDLVREHGIRQLHLDQVRPRDAGQRSDDELRAMMPRYTAMVPYFRAMLDRFDRELGPDYDINVGNLPFCLMPERAAKIHHDGEPTRTVAADGDQLSRPWDKYADKRSDKFHPPACARCTFRPRCNGIFRKYAQFHGVDEFVPVLAPAPRPRLGPDPPAMKYRTLPGTTLQLSAIGLRCRPGDALADTVAAAIDLGVDWFTLSLAEPDLAEHLSKVVGPRRHDLVLATTLEADTPAAVIAAVESGLRRLDLAALPLVLLRSGDAALPACLDALASSQAAGKVTHFGLSPGTGACTPAVRAALPRLACLDVPHSLHDRSFAAGLRDLCVRTGPEGQATQRLGVLARNVLAGGLLAAPRDPIGRALATVGARLDVSPAALALAWVLRQPGISVAQVRVDDAGQLSAAALALDLLAQPRVWQALRPHIEPRRM